MYKEIKEKLRKQESGGLSFRSFIARKFKDPKSLNKIDIKLADKSNFSNEEERCFYKDLLQLYSTESSKVRKDTEAIRKRIKKVDAEIKQKSVELNKILPEFEEYNTAFETNSQKLEILKDAKILLKKEMFIKKQEAKMLSTRRKMKKNQITTMKKLQRQ